jgi:hypothetical protein
VVDDERSYLNKLRLPERRSAQERADAGEELEVQVPRHDVVGAALERADAHDRVRVGLGQHDHRHVPIPPPPGLARSQARAEVGLPRDHEVRQQPLGDVERTRGPRCAEDPEAVVPQLPLEVVPRSGLPFGQEDRVAAHGVRR